MKIKTPSLRLAAACLSLVASCALAREPIPADSFARVPAIQSVSMSTDGKNLVALIAAPGTDDKATALATWDLNAPEKGPIVTPSGDKMKFIAANALKADRVLAAARQEWSGALAGCGEGKTVGSTRTFVTKLYLTDTKLKDFDEAFANKRGSVGISKDTQRCFELSGSANLVSGLPLDPDNVIIAQTNMADFSSSYYLYNLRTEGTKLLFKGGGREQPGLFDPRNGDLLTKTEIEATSGTEFDQRILIKNPETGEFEVHENLTTKLSERYSLGIVGRDEESGKFYVLTDLFSDQVQAWMYDPKRREFDKEPLVAHPTYSISNLILGSQPSNFNKVLGFTVSGPEPETVYTDPTMKSIHDGLKKAFPGQSVDIQGYNNDLSRLLFETSSAQIPPAYHLLVDRKQVTLLGKSRPWMDSDSIGKQEWVTYPARDGMQIPAVLDLPAGWTKADGPLPTIIHPHGGPWARDAAGWDRSGWVPFLTSRGYAVLRPNYRGSAGLGRKLWLAGDAQWGEAMQDDKDDAAAWLVKQGIADKDRMAIFGYSYGGFAAAAAVVRPNSPYQCAIAGAPVTNLGRIGMSWSDNRLQRISQGNTVKGMDPMRNTDKANIPVLLYVGDRDVRTPKFHAEDFYSAVRGTVPAKLEIIADMPHSMPWYYRHQTETLGLIEDYLAKDCGPDGL